MTIQVRVNSTNRMPIIDLWRLIFKFTFDKKNCGYGVKKDIEDNLLRWNGYIKMEKARKYEKFGKGFDDYVPIGKKGSIIDEYEYQVGMMCSWVVREEKDEFFPRVEMFKRHKIDYRIAEPMCKVFPDCKHLRNYSAGRAALAQNMKDNPQDYQPIKGA